MVKAPEWVLRHGLLERKFWLPSLAAEWGKKAAMLAQSLRAILNAGHGGFTSPKSSIRLVGLWLTQPVSCADNRADFLRASGAITTREASR
jgi:hypothetical protein